jgi:general secretion pathway protein K
VHDERLQSETLMRAAIELSVYRAVTGPQGTLSRGSFAVRLGNANVAADFTAETARIDLNTAPRELLSGLFVGLGAPRNAADGYADQIIAWRAPPAQGGSDPASYYRAAGLPYSPRGAPFQHVAELGLVLGIPEAMVERATPFVTVYSGQPQINILDASPQVLAALPGMNPERLHAVLAQRQARPQNAQVLLATLGPAQALATTQGNKALRVTARIAFDSGQRMTIEAVIFVLDSGNEPYRVLTWRDDADDTRAEVR